MSEKSKPPAKRVDDYSKRQFRMRIIITVNNHYLFNDAENL